VSGRRGEAGYSLVALMAAIAVMMILLAAAMPSWRYVMRNDAEEELLSRGGEIADAIARYQRRHGNALPPSMEVLVQQRFLRRAYKDPMTKHGRWRLLRPGDAVLPGVPGLPSAGARPGATTATTTTTTTRPSAFSQPGQVMGGFQGVASTSTEKSLRIFNGRTKYNEWLFVAGQPRVVGRQAPAGPRPGSAAPSGSRPPGGAVTRP
jgi:type II secretory pathway pseudopilin PulG